MLDLMGAAARALEDLLFPRLCASCGALAAGSGAGAGFLCEECAATLVPVDPRTACPVCAAPCAPSGACADCRWLRPSFRSARSAFLYEGAVTSAIHLFKWRGRFDLAVPLGGALAALLDERAGRCDLIVPVPLSRRRLMERGYNQSTLLCQAARRVARVRTPLGISLLGRRDPPSHAASLLRDREARLSYTRDAFFVPERARPRLAGTRVLLVDDVMTTGATAHSCTEALLVGGARSVEVLTLLRTAS